MSATDWAGRRLHFIGIGGAGMSGLALVAHALGAAVTGSDRAESSYSERLRGGGHRAGDRPRRRERARGRRGGGVDGDRRRQPGARRARARPGQRVLHRGDLLAEVSRLKRCLAVAGTHGKTTTSGMAAHVLVELRPRPRLPDRRRAALDRHERRLGQRASGSWSRPTSPTARS